VLASGILKSGIFAILQAVAENRRRGGLWYEPRVPFERGDRRRSVPECRSARSFGEAGDSARRRRNDAAKGDDGSTETDLPRSAVNQSRVNSRACVPRVSKKAGIDLHSIRYEQEKAEEAGSENEVREKNRSAAAEIPIADSLARELSSLLTNKESAIRPIRAMTCSADRHGDRSRFPFPDVLIIDRRRRRIGSA
jgi:hypothetical protein